MKYNTHDHMMTRLPAARRQHLCKAQLDTVSLDAICVFFTSKVHAVQNGSGVLHR